MPRKPGVSNDLATAPISNSGRVAVPGPRRSVVSARSGVVSARSGIVPSSLRWSQRTRPMIEQQFDYYKHIFELACRFMAERQGKGRIKMPWWGIVEGSPTHALGGGGAMALSMDEQRILAEIERQLAADDPSLAVRLSTFGRPGLAAGLRTPRGRVLASFVVVAVLALLSLTAYSLIPLRVLSDRAVQGRSTAAPSPTEQATQASQRAPARRQATAGKRAAGQQSAAGQ